MVSILSLVLDPIDSASSMLGRMEGYSKAWNAGESWVPGGLNTFVATLTIDPTNPAVLYLALALLRKPQAGCSEVRMAAREIGD